MIKINKERLQEIMESEGWSQRVLARALGFSESYITLLINGIREPSREFMSRLTNLTGLSLSELFFCPDDYQNVRHKSRDLQKGNIRAHKGRKNATGAVLATNSRGKSPP